MKITLIGTGTPRPDLNRMGPATVIHTPAGPILVDCGDGTIHQLMRAGIPPESVKHLIFTHLHADHTTGFFSFLFGGWTLGRREMQVYGPARTRSLYTWMQEFWQEDIEYRMSLGRDGAGLRQYEVVEYGPGTVIDMPELRVTALPVIHPIETYALRFEAEGHVIVHSGDTDYCEDLILFSRGADILIHDASMVAGSRGAMGTTAWNRLSETHTTPAEAARIARLAGVKRLVLIHLPTRTVAEEILAECRTEFDGEVIVGSDLAVIEC